MKDSPPTAREIVVKTVVAHTVTYFAAGVAALVLFDYKTLIADSALGLSMRPLSHPMIMAGPLLQPVRGLLFGLAFYMLREPFFCKKNGWFIMWMVLVVFGIVGTFGAPPASLEGAIYTVVPLWVHLSILPELLLQSLLLAWILFYWVNHRQEKWLNRAMGAAFVVVLLLPAAGLVARL